MSSDDVVVVSPKLEQDLTRAAQAVPAGARGAVWATVTQEGVEATVAHRRGRLQFSGYAARAWGGSYRAGARAGVTW